MKFGQDQCSNHKVGHCEFVSALSHSYAQFNMQIETYQTNHGNSSMIPTDSKHIFQSILI